MPTLTLAPLATSLWLRPLFKGLIRRLIAFLWWVKNPLYAELKARDITPLPRDLVKKHMFDMAIEHSKLRWIVWFCRFADSALRHFSRSIFLSFVGLALMPASVLFDNHWMLIGSFLFIALPLTIVVTIVVPRIVIEILVKEENYFRWQFTRLPLTNRDSANNLVPELLLQRIERARRITGVTIEIAKLKKDPFIFACRTYFLRDIRVPIGAYNTGNDLLDNL